MALQTSGQISLNDIHIEAGGISVSGTQASINDTDIRGLIGKGSGVQMSFNEWYGASAYADWTLTQATDGAYTTGFNSTIGGSISPTTVNGATILAAYVVNVVVKGSPTYTFYTQISGNRSVNFFRYFYESSIGTLSTSSVTQHSYNSGANLTQWYWSLPSMPANWDGSGNLDVEYRGLTGLLPY